MSSLNHLTEGGAPTSPPTDVDWLHLLIGDWQVISDLAFADLVLWLLDPGRRLRRDRRSAARARARPCTTTTSSVRTPRRVISRQLEAPSTEVRIAASGDPRWFGAYAVREEAMPVVRDGRAIAVVARQTNLGGARTPSRLELNYVEAADDLMALMIAQGSFPLRRRHRRRPRAHPA